MPRDIILSGPTKLTTTNLTTLYTTPNNGLQPKVTHMVIAKLTSDAITYSIFLNASSADSGNALYYNIPTVNRAYTIREIYQQPLGIGVSGNSISAQCSVANAITITLFGIVKND